MNDLKKEIEEILKCPHDMDDKEIREFYVNCIADYILKREKHLLKKAIDEAYIEGFKTANYIVKKFYRDNKTFTEKDFEKLHFKAKKQAYNKFNITEEKG